MELTKQEHNFIASKSTHANNPLFDFEVVFTQLCGVIKYVRIANGDVLCRAVCAATHSSAVRNLLRGKNTK